MGFREWIAEKLNPAQGAIQMDQGVRVDTTTAYDEVRNFVEAYNGVEVIRRGTDMIVAGVCLFDYDVADPVNGLVPQKSIRKAKLQRLLNYEPNPYQDKQAFMSNCILDYVLEGNIFIYWDGAFLYHLPSNKITIVTDEKTFIKEYQYMGASRLNGELITFQPEEIIHIKENSSTSIYRGTSRLMAAGPSIATINKMVDFQDNFFKNGTVPGLVLESDNPIPDKIKQRMLASWATTYNPRTGGKRPLILDNGLKLKPLATVDFQELDFNISIQATQDSVLEALGVPAVLLNGGNNANISPNLRLFYLETVMPIVRKLTKAFERFFGYDIKPLADGVSAMQPDIKEQSMAITTLVNGGVITPNEARLEMRYPPDKDPESDKLRIPANIAGSAANPSVGGKPTGNQ